MKTEINNAISLIGYRGEVETATGMIEARNELVTESALVENVSGQSSQQIAVSLLGTINGILKSVEETRKKIKDPVLDLAKRIDGAAKNFVEPLVREKNRLEDLVNGYQRKLLSDQREAEAARQKELQDLQRREEELKKQLEVTTSPQQAAKIEQERQALATTAVTVVPIVPKADGQMIKPVWNYEVLNTAELFKARPDLCKAIEHSPAAIRAALQNGMRECKGLRIYEDVTSIVRAKQ